MRELPALFSTPMVQALLDNRKRMTRRTAGLEQITALTLQGFDFRYDSIEDGPDENGLVYFERLTFGPNEKPTEDYRSAKPQYLIGDYIWVREEHKVWQENNYWFCEYKDGSIVKKYYKELTLSTLYRLIERKTLGKWQRGRFLPKDFCRIWLECTGVRCERLNKINEEDALSEGAKIDWYDQDRNIKLISARSNFMVIWEDINGKESVELNPWVFVYEFKRIEKP